MSNENKTHYRKAFNSPYLSSADIVEPVILTVKNVSLEDDKTKKTKDLFNTVYFAESEIRQGEKLKPMILNATNSRTMKNLTGSAFIDDWAGTQITVYVDHNVRMMGETVEGLRISPEKPIVRHEIQQSTKQWENAVEAYKRDGNLNAVRKRVDVSEESERLIIQQAGQ